MRQVGKGEKSIAIFVPLTRKRDDIEMEVHGFRTSSVFDVSQTEGNPIPEPPQPERLTGGDASVFEAFGTLKAYALNKGFSIVTGSLPGEALGDVLAKNGTDHPARWPRARPAPQNAGA